MSSTPSSRLTMLDNKERAPRNRTITLKDEEKAKYKQKLLRLDKSVSLQEVLNRTINQDLFQVMDFLPKQSVDLLFIDPPYNLNKTFNSSSFKKKDLDTYTDWLDAFLSGLEGTLKPTSSIYICCDWQSSPAVFEAVKNRFQVRNRITWEREKGRGASKNWKNSSEDIWFCTVSDAYTFNVDAVKLKRKVIAPYTVNGTPKDWDMTEQGNYRLTHPSNLWTDLTIPFWSMPENTDHPTQKPEKLVAKAVLASSNPGDVVFDPFLGSGTTSVVAKKLGRQYFGVELDEIYACLAEKRLEIADIEPSIQGYSEGVFWERNTLNEQVRSVDKKRNARNDNGRVSQQQELFLLTEPQLSMEKSQIFYSGKFDEVQESIREFLNFQEDYLSASTANSTRAVGDAIQDILGSNLQQVLSEDVCKNYSASFARRAMADLAFEDDNGFYYVIDVKTHRLSTKFNMPNLTSVERLARFYESDKNVFAVLMVAYDVEGTRVEVERVTFVPIEFLGWDCLTIGALGWGQIQIANSNVLTVNPGYSRKQWMLELCDALAEFYPREMAKIEARLIHFAKIKEFWLNHSD